MHKSFANKTRKLYFANMTITGKWEIAKAEIGGQELPAESYENLVLDMDESSYRISKGELLDSGIIEGIEAHDPSAILIKAEFGFNKGKTFQCIYRFDGEDLTMCYNLAGDGIPTSFDSSTNTLYYTAIYRRV